jgi:hypothetical protein
MRLHRILPLAAAALIAAACQAEDPTSPTLAPAGSARLDEGSTGGGYTTTSTTPPDTTSNRGVNMFGGG